DHLEVCLPEVISAYDHVAATHAMLRVARCALRRANEKLPEGHEIQVMVNNSDGKSHSYGSHLNFLVRRSTWDNIFGRKLHHLLVLASHQVSSIAYSGQGKVGSENGRSWVPYQLSQRADFFERMSGAQTTHTRPLVNSRDEALCGRAVSPQSTSGFRHSDRGPDVVAGAERLARVHSIFFDSTLCHVATLLKVGTMQMVLTMIEAGVLGPELILDDPLGAVIGWSHDPSLRSTAALASGGRVTAVEHQEMFLERARKFAELGGFLDVVPRAREILDLWEDTLIKLTTRDLGSLAGRLDWVLKLGMLEHACRSRRLEWDSQELKYLDLMYGNLDDEVGLYWSYEAGGHVESLVSDSEIQRFVDEPPDDTRAFTRAMLLRTARPEWVRDVDWDAITFEAGFGAGQRIVTVDLGQPHRFGKRETGDVFSSSRGGDLREVLRAGGLATGRDGGDQGLRSPRRTGIEKREDLLEEDND
ncbi:MAG: proteasome accessory factor PafA2 family protein, partial [Candidatus Binatia bacterium]